jgi:hypothetical protein
MSSKFSLVLFSTDTTFIPQAVASGVDVIIVDWENRGKEIRQTNWNTQINYDTPEDLRKVRVATGAPLLCRINGYGTTTKREVEEAIEKGADEVILPMVRSLREVEAVLDQVRSRIGVGILIETLTVLSCLDVLASLPLSRVYVGLNDLAIERKTPHIFSAIIDGALEEIRRHFRVPFGFGGLTLPDRGFPIPCRLLIGEMMRLGCNFTFLRRSFHRDIQGHKVAEEIPRLREAIRQASLRSLEDIEKDHRELEKIISALS